jgi:hypothetical protein
MGKTHVLLSGEAVLLKSLSQSEQNAVKTIQKLIADDPEGDGRGNFFELLKIIMRFPQNSLCRKVLDDVVRRAGIAQNIIAAPEHEKAVKSAGFMFSVIPFATAAKYFGFKFSELRRLLENKTIEGEKVGNVWFVVLSSMQDYQKNKKTV